MRALQTLDVLLHGQRAAVFPSLAYQRTHQLAPERFQPDFQSLQSAVVLHEHGLVLRRPRPDRGEEFLVLLVLPQRFPVRSHHAGPERGEELALEPFLGVGLAHDGALEVQELAVDALEQCDQLGAIGQFCLDTLFQYTDKFVEGAVQCLVGPLRRRHAEQSGEELAGRGLKPGGATFEYPGSRQKSMDIGKSTG